MVNVDDMDDMDCMDIMDSTNKKGGTENISSTQGFYRFVQFIPSASSYG
jgi:hypothetical protein